MSRRPTHEETCTVCGGTGISGTKTCLNCNGLGYTKCVECSGKGRCNWCKGTGRALISGDSCRYCNGTGKCKRCNGTGSIGTCTRCGGEGTENVKCSTCNGTGKITVSGGSSDSGSSGESQGSYSFVGSVDAWKIWSLSNGSYSLDVDKIDIYLRTSTNNLYVKQGSSYERVWENSFSSFGSYNVSGFSYTATHVVSLGNSIHWFFDM